MDTIGACEVHKHWYAISWHHRHHMHVDLLNGSMLPVHYNMDAQGSSGRSCVVVTVE